MRGEASFVALEPDWYVSVRVGRKDYVLAVTRSAHKHAAIESLAVEVARALDAPLHIGEAPPA